MTGARAVRDAERAVRRSGSPLASSASDAGGGPGRARLSATEGCCSQSEILIRAFRVLE